MGVSYDVVIPVRSITKRLRASIEDLNRQSMLPARIILADASSADLHVPELKSSRVPLIITDKTAPYDGSLYMAGLKHCASDLVLILQEGAVLTDRRSAEKFLEVMQDMEVAAVYGGGYRNTRNTHIGKVLFYTTYGEKLTECRMQDIYEYGPLPFSRKIVAAMFRRELLERYGFEPNGLSRPEYVLNAQLLYGGHVLRYAPEITAAYRDPCSVAGLFHEAFDYGAARKLYYSSFGIGFRNIKRSMGFMYRENGIKAIRYLSKRGAVHKVPYVLLLTAARWLGNYFGQHYHRLPMGLVRRFAGNRAFFE